MLLARVGNCLWTFAPRCILLSLLLPVDGVAALNQAFDRFYTYSVYFLCMDDCTYSAQALDAVGAAANGRSIAAV